MTPPSQAASGSNEWAGSSYALAGKMELRLGIPRMRRYIVPALIGFGIGVFSLFAVGFLADFSGTGWSIPTNILYDGGFERSIESLHTQAALLRTAHLFLDQGIQYLLIPTLAAVGITYACYESPTHTWDRLIYRIMWLFVTGILTAMFIAFMCMQNQGISFANIRTTQFFEHFIFLAMGWMILLVPISFAFAIAELVKFLITGGEYCKTSPSIASKTSINKDAEPESNSLQGKGKLVRPEVLRTALMNHNLIKQKARSDRDVAHPGRG